MSSVLLPSFSVVERKWFAVLVVSQSTGFGKQENEQIIAIAQKCVVGNAIVSDFIKAVEKHCMTFLPLWQKRTVFKDGKVKIYSCLWRHCSSSMLKLSKWFQTKFKI